MGVGSGSAGARVKARRGDVCVAPALVNRSLPSTHDHHTSFGSVAACAVPGVPVVVRCAVDAWRFLNHR